MSQRRPPSTRGLLHRRFVTPKNRSARTHIANGVTLFWADGRVVPWYGSSLCGRSYRTPSFADHIPLGHEPCTTCERKADERTARAGAV